MPELHRVALLGFSAAERATLVTAFAGRRSHGPQFEMMAAMLPMLDDADVLIADADDAPTVQLVVVTERVGDTLFIGSRPAPFGAAAWMPRPIDPQHVLRELDALVNPLLGDGRIDPPLAAAAGPLPPFPPLEAWPASEAPPSTPVPPSEPPKASAPARDTVVMRAAAVRERTGLRPWTPPAAPGARALRALVVDDSDTARQFLRGRLEAWGLDVDTAASSGQALGLLLRQHFDHLFIDVELGSGSKLDGLALCQLVRRKNICFGGAPELVVIVSAHHGEIDRARGMLAGCDAYLSKPLDEGDLQQLLRRQGLTPPASTSTIPATPQARG